MSSSNKLVIKWYMSIYMYIGYTSGVNSQRLCDRYILSAMTGLVPDCCVVKSLHNGKYLENNIVTVKNGVKLNWSWK